MFVSNQSYFVMRFTRFTEETTLYRSCYVLLTLYEPKLLSKYSAIKSFTLRNLSKNIYLKLSSSKNVFFNLTNMKDFLYKFCSCAYIFILAFWNHSHRNGKKFFPLLQLYWNDVITWKKIIPEWRDSSFVKVRSPLLKTTRQSQKLQSFTGF